MKAHCAACTVDSIPIQNLAKASNRNMNHAEMVSQQKWWWFRQS